jgi:hypothetical protein
VIIYGEPAQYFAGVFMADWRQDVQEEDLTGLSIPTTKTANMLFLPALETQLITTR